MTNAAYGKFTVGLIVAWFIFSLFASALHLFQGDASQPPLAVGLAAMTPILLFLLWYAASAEFRTFALSLNPRWLTFAQTWRVLGFIFVLLYAFGKLPGIFALPAGLGDMAIGATAPFIARNLATPQHRKGFIVWQVLGITDLVMAVSLGVASRLINPHGVAADVMTVLPMSLVPTFFVPLLLIFHLICIAQARRWSTRHATIELEHAA